MLWSERGARPQNTHRYGWREMFAKKRRQRSQLYLHTHAPQNVKEAAKNSTAAFAKIVINSNVWRQRILFCHFLRAWYMYDSDPYVWYMQYVLAPRPQVCVGAHRRVFVYLYCLTIQYSVRHQLKLETRSEGRLSVLWHRWNRQCMCSSGVSVSRSPT